MKRAVPRPFFVDDGNAEQARFADAPLRGRANRAPTVGKIGGVFGLRDPVVGRSVGDRLMRADARRWGALL